MPVHDWSRVGAGTFPHFHGLWIGEISNALNDGVLPANYYAMTEQIIGDMIPDVLALEAVGSIGVGPGGIGPGMTTVAEAPPRVRFTATLETDAYASTQRRLVIRHGGGDRIVALIEIVSPGNKGSRHALESFVEKSAAALARGYHLLLIDLQPQTPRDPEGIHGAIWAEFGDASYEAPADKPLTLAAYSAGPAKTAYVEPIAGGDPLPEMPLFLDSWSYVNVPLEATYRAAWRGVPRRWRDVLEPPAA